MSDQTEKYVKLLKQNVDRIVIVVVWLLFLVMGYLWMSERSGVIISEQEGQQARLNDVITEDPNYGRALRLATQTDIRESSNIERLRRFNMFDPKAVRQKEQIEKEANVKLDLARDAASKGQREEALRLVNEVLLNFPTDQRAKDMKQELEGARRGTAPRDGGDAPAAPPAAPGV